MNIDKKDEEIDNPIYSKIYLKNNNLNHIYPIIGMNIDDEIDIVVLLINNPKYNKKYFKYNVSKYYLCNYIGLFVKKLIFLANRYPILEEYLGTLLTKIIDNNVQLVFCGFNDKWNLLHHMAFNVDKISFKTFKIIIEKNICDINYALEHFGTSLHILLNYSITAVEEINKMNNIVKLYISNGFDLNIACTRGLTVFDQAFELTCTCKSIIETLIDAGATLNRNYSDWEDEETTEMTEFIQSYKCQYIKPAKR